jgi:carbonic anhydrase/acetyltransferase-like protein (isoleucine patch superfamily)
MFTGARTYIYSNGEADMKELKALIEEIVRRVDTNLREFKMDSGRYTANALPLKQLLKFYAFYGITTHHPIDFHFGHSSLAGSYFLGKCHVSDSIVYKTDIRGDELKRQGKQFRLDNRDVHMHHDEGIRVQHSFLIKTLVHSFNHDPEFPEYFPIVNSIAAPYANIHGAPIRGCFIGPFATVDLTTVHDCEIGAFAYIQTGELSHTQVEPGSIWIHSGYTFHFLYQYPAEALREYIDFTPDNGASGILFEFVENRKPHFQEIFDVVHLDRPDKIHRNRGTALNRYAVVRGDCQIGENVLVAQRAYLENSELGRGANAQENCYIINSRLEGYNVTAHGAKIINAHLGEKTFVGFNCFVRCGGKWPLTIGNNSIVMPHTIIDLAQPMAIPDNQLVWGLVRNEDDLRENSIPLNKLTDSKGSFRQGRLHFQGSGKAFVEGFQKRIEHILRDNGAYYDGRSNKGHAQQGQDISFNIIQPYNTGGRRGIFPTIDIYERSR